MQNARSSLFFRAEDCFFAKIGFNVGEHGVAFPIKLFFNQEVSEMYSRIEVKKANDVVVVLCLDPKLNDEYTIQEWGDQLEAVAEMVTKALILDFNKVKFMSSSALRVLITLQKMTDLSKVPLLLCNLNDDIMEIFKITNLETIFKIRKGVDEAIRSLQYLK
jgi:anti-sigma B factor antagonist